MAEVPTEFTDKDIEGLPLAVIRHARRNSTSGMIGALRLKIMAWWERPGPFWLGQSNGLDVVRIFDQNHPGWDDKRGSFDDYLRQQERFEQRLLKENLTGESRFLGIGYRPAYASSTVLFKRWVVSRKDFPEEAAAGILNNSDKIPDQVLHIPTGGDPYCEHSYRRSSRRAPLSTNLLEELDFLLEDPGITRW